MTMMMMMIACKNGKGLREHDIGIICNSMLVCVCTSVRTDFLYACIQSVFMYAFASLHIVGFFVYVSLKSFSLEGEHSCFNEIEHLCESKIHLYIQL